MDLARLKTAYARNKRLAAVIDLLPREPDARGRPAADQDKTTVNKIYSALLRAGDQLPKKEIFDILRELERYGLGTLVFGRRGHESRIEWNVPTTSLAAAARGEHVPEAEEVETEEDEDDEDEDEENGAPIPSAPPSRGHTERPGASAGDRQVVAHQAPVADAPAHRRKGFVASRTRTPALIPHSFALREDVPVSFWLPSNFTKSEALMLIGFITQLPAQD